MIKKNVERSFEGWKKCWQKHNRGDAKTLGNALKRAGEFMGALERA